MKLNNRWRRKHTKHVRFSRRVGGKATRKMKRNNHTPKPILLNGLGKEAKMEELNLDIPTKLNKNAIIMGIIYAKWCPHCKELIPDENDNTRQPKWQQTIDIIKGMPNRNKDIYYIQLEDDEIKNHGKLDKLNQRCKTRITANGFPTVFRITGGQLEMYQGEREPNAMADWFIQ